MPPYKGQPSPKQPLAVVGDVALQLARASEGLSLDHMMLLLSKIARKVASCQGMAYRGAVLRDLLEQGLQVARMGSDCTCSDGH